MHRKLFSILLIIFLFAALIPAVMADEGEEPPASDRYYTLVTSTVQKNNGGDYAEVTINNTTGKLDINYRLNGVNDSTSNLSPTPGGTQILNLYGGFTLSITVKFDGTEHYFDKNDHAYISNQNALTALSETYPTYHLSSAFNALKNDNFGLNMRSTALTALNSHGDPDLDIYDDAALDAILANIQQTARDIVAEAGAGSAYAKTKAISQWFVDNFEFSNFGYGGEPFHDLANPYTIWGKFLEARAADLEGDEPSKGQAVCYGYAQIVELMLQTVDVPTYIVRGNMNTHVWNVVYVDGAWRILDVTALGSTTLSWTDNFLVDFTYASGGSRLFTTEFIPSLVSAGPAYGGTSVMRTSGKIVKVTLDANGGSIAREYIYTAAKDSNTDYYSNLTNPTREGYTFGGWYLTPEFDGAVIARNTVVSETENHTLYAKWTNTNANLLTLAGQELIHGSEFGGLSTPKTSEIFVSASVLSVQLSDLTFSEGATIELYSDDAFSIPVPAGVLTLDPDNTTHLYIKLISQDGNKTVHYDVSISYLPTYTITIVDGIDLTNLGPYEEGVSIQIKADIPLAGYRFSGWTCDDATGVFDNASSMETTFTVPASDATITANYSLIPSGGPSGGGSKPNNNEPTPTVTVEASENASVTVNQEKPSKGDTVTVSVTPDEGYKVEEIIITDKNGNSIDSIVNEDGTYSFIFNGELVTIEVVVAPIVLLPELPFEDIEGHWAEEEILAIQDYGIIEETNAGEFSPDETLTRGEVIVALWHLAGKPTAGTNSEDGRNLRSETLTDYANALTWAKENGIIIGYDNGLIGAEDIISRQDLMLVIYRYMEYSQIDNTRFGEYFTFTDSDSIADYSMEAVQTLFSIGIVKGVGDGSIDPTAGATRAQAAAIFSRLIAIAG